MQKLILDSGEIRLNNLIERITTKTKIKVLLDGKEVYEGFPQDFELNINSLVVDTISCKDNIMIISISNSLMFM